MTIYVWRKRRYATIAGLHNAMLRVWPGTAISFVHDWCLLHKPDGTLLHFARGVCIEGEASIADSPTEGGV